MLMRKIKDLIIIMCTAVIDQAHTFSSDPASLTIRKFVMITSIVTNNIILT